MGVTDFGRVILALTSHGRERQAISMALTSISKLAESELPDNERGSMGIYKRLSGRRNRFIKVSNILSMAGTLKRPILVGGLSLSFALWLLDRLDRSIEEFGEWGVLGLIALGVGAWWLKQQAPKPLPETVPATIDRLEAEAALTQARTILDRLAEEIDGDLGDLQQAWEKFHQQLDRKTLKIAIVGGRGVGKSSLLKALTAQWLETETGATLCKLPSFFRRDEADDLPTALAADLVVFLIEGDLTDTERQTLQQLKDAGQTVLLALNKRDRYCSIDLDLILDRVSSHVTGLLERENLCSIAAAPEAIEVRQHQADKTVRQFHETPDAEIASLTQLLDRQLDRRSELVWGSVYRQAKAFQETVKDRLNAVRRERALPVITQYQWVAAAAAFANPIPTLDLLATGAISAQLVLDLGNIYQQRLSLQQAQTAAGTLGSLIAKQGLVELSTELATHALKHNPVTFVAGGTVQGIGAAYLTRVAGLSLVEYFEQQEIDRTSNTPLNWNRLGDILQSVFAANQRTEFVRSLVRQTLDRLSPSATPSSQNTMS